MISKIIRTLFKVISNHSRRDRVQQSSEGNFEDAFRAKLREVRLRQGLTHQDLARRCQYEAHYLEQVEHGDLDPSLEAVRRIAKALGLDPRELMFGSSPDAEAVRGRVIEEARNNGDEHQEDDRGQQAARIVDERLQQVQQRYDRLFQSAPFGYVAINESGKIVDLNQKFKSMVRWDDSYVRGRHINTFIVPEDQDQFYEYRRDLLEGDRKDSREVRFVTPGGDVLVGSLYSRLIRSSDHADRIGLALVEVTPLLEAYDRLKEEQSEEMKQARDANPLTELPGNVTIRKTIESYLGSDREFALIYADIDHFKSFNDRYGFERGDEVLLLLRDIFRRGLEVFEAPENFLGHVGGDDFVVLTSPGSSEPLCEWVIKEFDREMPEYYDESDREQGGITIENRQGEKEFYPFLTLSLAVVKNDQREFRSYLEMSEVAAEVKSYVKRDRGTSSYMVDRRDES